MGRGGLASRACCPGGSGRGQPLGPPGGCPSGTLRWRRCSSSGSTGGASVACERHLPRSCGALGSLPAPEGIQASVGAKQGQVCSPRRTTGALAQRIPCGNATQRHLCHSCLWLRVSDSVAFLSPVPPTPRQRTDLSLDAQPLLPHSRLPPGTCSPVLALGCSGGQWTPAPRPPPPSSVQCSARAGGA